MRGKINYDNIDFLRFILFEAAIEVMKGCRDAMVPPMVRPSAIYSIFQVERVAAIAVQYASSPAPNILLIPSY